MTLKSLFGNFIKSLTRSWHKHWLTLTFLGEQKRESKDFCVGVTIFLAKLVHAVSCIRENRVKLLVTRVLKMMWERRIMSFRKNNRDLWLLSACIYEKLFYCKNWKFVSECDRVVKRQSFFGQLWCSPVGLNPFCFL